LFPQLVTGFITPHGVSVSVKVIIVYQLTTLHLKTVSYHGDKSTVWLTGVRFPGGAKEGGFFSSPPHPYRLWGSPSLPFSVYVELCHRGESGRGVKLTTHLNLVPRLGMRGVIPPFFHTYSWWGA